MVVDNAACHSNIEEVFSEEEFLGCEVQYSPMFNPIEQVWSLIKAYIKQELAAKIVSILAIQSFFNSFQIEKGSFSSCFIRTTITNTLPKNFLSPIFMQVLTFPLPLNKLYQLKCFMIWFSGIIARKNLSWFRTPENSFLDTDLR